MNTTSKSTNENPILGAKANASESKGTNDKKEKQEDKQKTAPESAAKSSSKPVKKRVTKKSHFSFGTTFILLVSILAAGLAAYDFWLLRIQSTVNKETSHRANAVETRVSRFEQEVQNTQQQLAAEVSARENLQAQQQAANASVQSISEKLGRSTVAWRMAEVEYLLTVANHRLSLAKDRQTAIAVFETADSRLQAIADPALLTVRKKVASEIAALRAVPNVDIPGIAVQLASMAESVEQLPLIDKKRVEIATEKPESKSDLEWREIPEAVWNDVKSLVVVRRHQKATEPLLPPKEAWFLYQNLQLKLEQAKLVALQKNTALFVQSLNEASSWLADYFDTESTAVESMQESLDKLKKKELRPSLPDVSASLRELRAVMSRRSELKLSAASEVKLEKAAAQ